MVSNTSSFQQDLAELGATAAESAQDLAHSVGIDIGYRSPIPGDPARLHELADRLQQLSTTLNSAGEAYKRLETGGWTGPAGDAFRANYLETAPSMWLKAADALGDGATAVRTYADELARQQQAASAAAQALQDAHARTEQARQQYNAKVEANVDPGPWQDPGAAAAAQAERDIAKAKAAVANAAKQAAYAVRATTTGAPEKGLLDYLGIAVDAFQATTDTVSEFLGGFGAGAWEMGKSILLTPGGELALGLWDMLQNPDKAQQVAASVQTMWTQFQADPLGTAYTMGKTMLGIEQLRDNPARWAGEMTPGAIAAAATAGAGTAGKLTSGLGKVARKLDDIGQRPGIFEHHGQPPGPGAPPRDHGAHAQPPAPPQAPPAHHPAPPASGSPVPFEPRPDGEYEKPFGPRGSDPAPEPDPAPDPGPTTSRREMPDWDDHTPDSWMDDGSGHHAQPELEPPPQHSEPAPGPDPQQIMAKKEHVQRLEAALKDVEDRLRSPEGLTPNEIASLRTNADLISRELDQARADLKRLLGGR
ncbi:putative T7SS-secreted protein [Saccharopolyspora thermophila]|uniref:Putative T7SS secretion signal domain-containing protein n=1 Tax=Saccharopolyspora thermophila TaxID=89367 RepID=A0ABN1D589_9PSEU